MNMDRNPIQDALSVFIRVIRGKETLDATSMDSRMRGNDDGGIFVRTPT